MEAYCNLLIRRLTVCDRVGIAGRVHWSVSTIHSEMLCPLVVSYMTSWCWRFGQRLSCLLTAEFLQRDSTTGTWISDETSLFLWGDASLSLPLSLHLHLCRPPLPPHISLLFHLSGPLFNSDMGLCSLTQSLSPSLPPLSFISLTSPIGPWGLLVVKWVIYSWIDLFVCLFAPMSERGLSVDVSNSCRQTSS